jgi:hypothetical protein
VIAAPGHLWIALHRRLRAVETEARHDVTVFETMTEESRLLFVRARELSDALTPDRCVSSAHLLAAMAASDECGLVLRDAGLSGPHGTEVVREVVEEQGEPRRSDGQLSQELVSAIRPLVGKERESVGPTDVLALILNARQSLGISLLERVGADVAALRRKVQRSPES